MVGLLARVATLVAMTHGLRVLGQLAGPRQVGLVLGLPSTTAVVLIGCGLERGSAVAAAAAEAGLLGLVATVALPLAYAQAVGRGWRPPWAIATAAAGYAAVAWALGGLPELGAVGGLVLASAGVLGAWALAGRRPDAGPTCVDRAATGTASARILALRTAVPAACLAAIEGLGHVAGARWAGLLSTFPGMTLALLAATHLEAGPAEAGRMARALPPGNLGMVAFLAAVRFGCPVVGLGGAIALGYASALTALAAVGRLVPGVADRDPRARPAPSDRYRPGMASPRTARVRPRVAVRRVPARRPAAPRSAPRRRSGPARTPAPRVEARAA